MSHQSAVCWHRAADLKLIETYRWDRGTGFYLEAFHLARLARSADALGFVFPVDDVYSALRDYTGGLQGDCHRVRLTLDRAGRIAITSAGIDPPNPNACWRVALADTVLDPTDDRLAHKTTDRGFYDEARERAKAAIGADEVVFTNVHGAITEGSITTVFVRDGETLKTPPLSAGLLPGCLRAAVLADPRAFGYANAYEHPLTWQDLLAAEAVLVGNAVRGLIRAQLVNAVASA